MCFSCIHLDTPLSGNPSSGKMSKKGLQSVVPKVITVDVSRIEVFPKLSVCCFSKTCFGNTLPDISINLS